MKEEANQKNNHRNNLFYLDRNHRLRSKVRYYTWDEQKTIRELGTREGEMVNCYVDTTKEGNERFAIGRVVCDQTEFGEQADICLSFKNIEEIHGYQLLSLNTSAGWTPMRPQHTLKIEDRKHVIAFTFEKDVPMRTKH